MSPNPLPHYFCIDTKVPSLPTVAELWVQKVVLFYCSLSVGLSFCLDLDKFAFFSVCSSFGLRTTHDFLPLLQLPLSFATCLPPPLYVGFLALLGSSIRVSDLFMYLPFSLPPSLWVSLLLCRSLFISPTVPTVRTKSRCLRRTCLASPRPGPRHSTVPLRAFQLQTKSSLPPSPTFPGPTS